MFEIFGYTMLALIVISNAVDFFFPQKRFEYIYNKTAKDVNFNRYRRK